MFYLSIYVLVKKYKIVVFNLMNHMYIDKNRLKLPLLTH